MLMHHTLKDISSLSIFEETMIYDLWDTMISIRPASASVRDHLKISPRILSKFWQIN